MADSLEVILAKAMVEAIETARDGGDLIYSDSVVVEGNGATPDPSGTYTISGSVWGYDAFTRDDDADFTLQWENVSQKWWIFDADSGAYWTLDTADLSPEGTYTPAGGGATGNPTASAVTSFDVNWEFSNRIELQTHGNIPEEWKLTDDRLQVRVMIPQRQDFVARVTRGRFRWVTHLDIDVRQKLGVGEQQSDQAIDRDELSKLGAFTEQLFLKTGRDLTAARFSGLTDLVDTEADSNAQWMGADRTDLPRGVDGSAILFKYHAEWLAARQYYGAIRQVYMVT